MGKLMFWNKGLGVGLMWIGMSLCGCTGRTDVDSSVPVLPRTAMEAVVLENDSIPIRGVYLAPINWEWRGCDTLIVLSPESKGNILYAFSGDSFDLFTTGGAMGSGPAEYRTPFLAGNGRANNRMIWIGDRQLGWLDRWRLAGDSLMMEHRTRLGGATGTYDALYGVEVLSDSVGLVKYDSGEELTLDLFDFIQDSVVGHVAMSLRPDPPGGARMFYDFAIASRGDLIVLGYMFMNRIEGRRFSEGQLVPVWQIGEEVDRPDEWVANGELEKLTIGYTDLRLSDSLIYALYQGCKTDNVLDMRSTVEIYDFEGRAVERWDLGRPISRILIDESRRLLYALGSNSDVIYQYRLPDRAK